MIGVFDQARHVEKVKRYLRGELALLRDLRIRPEPDPRIYAPHTYAARYWKVSNGVADLRRTLIAEIAKLEADEASAEQAREAVYLAIERDLR